MSKPALFFVNPSHFEKWCWQNPDTVGIGGSETSSIEMSIRLAAHGYDVTNYVPLPADCPDREHAGVHWRDLSEADYAQPGIWILYRCPEIADQFPPPGTRHDQQLWLVCQDEDYPSAWWHSYPGNTESQVYGRQDKLHRVVALCEAQAASYRRKYARMASKVCVSSNGLRRELVESVLDEPQDEPRNPYRMLYPSSPDRALVPLLEIFARVRERVPQAELWVAYGFDNIEKIVARVLGTPEAERCPGDVRYLKWVTWLKGELQKPGVRHFGRMPQRELYRLWRQCGLWVYANRFRETSPVHGDTLVHTQRGKIPIRSLVGSNVGVWSVNEFGSAVISAATDIRCTRENATVVKLTIEGDDGDRRELILTPDHEVMLAAWNKSVLCDPRAYLPAGECKPGTRVFLRHENAPQTLSATDKPFVSGVVIANDPAGAANVFCMQVLPAHNFIANGVVVHNCITSMEAQSLGAIPVICPIWAVGENVQHGVTIREHEPTDDVDGMGTARPLGGYIDDPLTLARFADETVRLMREPWRQEMARPAMMRWAAEHFDYERFVGQWVEWIEGREGVL